MAARKATPAVIAISAGRYGIGRDNSSRRLGGNDFMSGGDGDDLVYTDGVDHLLDCEAVILGPELADAWDRLMNLN